MGDERAPGRRDIDWRLMGPGLALLVLAVLNAREGSITPGWAAVGSIALGGALMLVALMRACRGPWAR